MDRVHREHQIEWDVAVGATCVAVVFGFLARLLDFLRHRLRVELGVTPDFRWGLHAELVLVEVQSFLVLRVEHIRLFVESDELGRMVEEMLEHVLAELPIASGEMQVFMPDDIDDFRRGDPVVTGDAQEDELLVLANGEVGEFRRPAVLLGDFSRECPGERIGTAEGA